MTSLSRDSNHDICQDHRRKRRKFVTIPASKLQNFTKKVRKKDKFIKELIGQEKCNLCKIKMFQNFFIDNFDIPEVDMKEFLTELGILESRYIQNSESKSSFIQLNHHFLNLNPYLVNNGYKKFIHLKIIKHHFDVCIFKGLKNGRIKRFNEYDDHIKMFLQPNFMYVRDPETNELGPNHETIKSVLNMQRGQEVVLNQYLKLNKIM